MHNPTRISSTKANDGTTSFSESSSIDYIVRVTVKLQSCMVAKPLIFEAPMQGTITGKAVENKIHIVHDFGGIESEESFDVIETIVIREHQGPYTRVTFTPNGEDRPTGRVEIGLTVDDFSTLAGFVSRQGTQQDQISHSSYRGVIEVTGVAYGPVNTTQTLVADVIQVLWEGKLLPNEAEEIGIQVKPNDIHAHLPPPHHNDPAKGFQGQRNQVTSLTDALRLRLADNHEAELCPRCGSAMIPQKNGLTGSAFFGCTKFPECKGTRSVKTTAADGCKCPICQSAMVRKTAKVGPYAGQAFWGCSKYPHCKGKRN